MLFDTQHKFGNGLETLLECRSGDYFILLSLALERVQQLELVIEDIYKHLSNHKHHKQISDLPHVKAMFNPLGERPNGTGNGGVETHFEKTP